MSVVLSCFLIMAFVWNLSAQILGYRTDETSTNVCVGNSINIFQFTATSSFTATNMKVKLASATGPLVMAIYSDNGSDAPGTLLSGTAQLASPTAGAWNDIALSSNISVVNGTKYWLGAWATNPTFYQAATPGNLKAYYKDDYTGTIPNWPTPNPVLDYWGAANSQCIFAYENYSASWPNSTNFYLNTTSGGANVAGNVTKFPVLIRLNPSNFTGFVSTQPLGADIRFTKSNGVPLFYEIERWKDVTGDLDTAEIWVLVDTVYGNNSSQYITMRYGKSSVPSMSNPTAVFDSSNGFAGVWHLGEPGNTTAGGYKDATVNANNGTGEAGMPGSDAPAMIGRGQTMGWTGTQNRFITVPNVTSLNVTRGSFSTWVNSDRIFDDLKIINKRLGGPEGYALAANSSKVRLCVAGGCHLGNTVMSISTWYFLSATVDASNNYVLYLNGISDASGTTSITTITEPVILASAYSGLMDEARIENVARSADWMKLCYQNQQANQLLVFSSTTGNDRTWTGASNANWNTVGNWNEAQVPVNGNRIVFNSLSTGAASTNNNVTGLTGLAIQVTNTGTAKIITGNALDLGSNGIDMSTAAQDLTISSNVNLSAPQSWNINTSRILTVSGVITLANNLTVNSSANAGTLLLSGGNGGNGIITLGGGTLKIANNSALGTATGNTVVSSGATLDLNGASSTEPLTLAGTGVGGNGALTNSSATESFSGQITLTADATIGGNAGGIIIGRTGGNYGITKVGSNMLTLYDQASTYTGITTINGGTIKIVGSGDALGTSAGKTVVNSGYTLDMNGITYQTAEPLDLNGNGIGGNGALINSSSTTSATFPGTITLQSASRFGVTGSQDLIITGQITGSYGIVVNSSGSGRVILQNAGQNNNYTGTTTVNAGILCGDVISYNKLAFPSTTAVTVNSGATFTPGNNEVVGSIAGSGSLLMLNTTFTCGGNNTSTNFSGPISDMSGPGYGAITKTGTGTLTLSGNSASYGATTVSAGTLLITNTSGSGAGYGDLTVSGGTFGGTGIDSGAVIVTSGTLSPGVAGPGKLTIRKANATALNLGASAILAYDLGTASDSIVCMGTASDVTLGSATVNVTAATGYNTGTYTLITCTGTITGTLNVGTIPNGYSGAVSIDNAGTPRKVSLVISGSAVATPVFTPDSGTYCHSSTVSITCATAGATIYYTTDGNTPTTGSSVYNTPLDITATTTLKAMATMGGMSNSAVQSKIYTIATTVIYTVPDSSSAVPSGCAAIQSRFIPMLPTVNTWNTLTVRWNCNYLTPYGTDMADWFGFSFFDPGPVVNQGADQGYTWFPESCLVIGHGRPADNTLMKSWIRSGAGSPHKTITLDTALVFIDSSGYQNLSHMQPRSYEVILEKIAGAAVKVTARLKKGTAIHGTLIDTISAANWSVIAGRKLSYMTASGRHCNGGSRIIVSNKYVSVAAAAPHIAYSPTSFTRTTNVGVNVPSDTFTISNAGGIATSLNYSFSILHGSTWLVTNPLSDTTSGKKIAINYSTNSPSLPEGIYKDTILIKSTNADNDSQKIPIQVTVTAVPVLSVNPMSKTKTITEGSSLGPDSFYVWNSGTGTLSYTLTERHGPLSWVQSLSPTGSSSTDSLHKVTELWAFNTTTLPPGTFVDTVVVRNDSGGATITLYYTLTITPRPLISIDKSVLTYAVQTGQNVSPDSIKISNGGTGTLAYIDTILNKSAWLSLSSQSGSKTSTDAPDRIDVTFAMSSLSNGVYTDTIVFSATGASNSPIKVPVTVTVTSSPAISLSPQSFTKTAVATRALAADSFVIWNGGTGGFDYTLSSTSGRVTVNPTSGHSDGEKDTMQLTFATTTLAAGTYRDTIIVQATGATNSPQRIPVDIVITQQPSIVTSVGSFAHTISGGQDITTPDTLEIWNGGSDTLRYTLSKRRGQSWWTPAPLLGTSAGSSNRSIVSIAYTVSGLNGGFYFDTLLITAPGSSNTPAKVPIEVTVTATPMIGLSTTSLSRNAVKNVNPANDAVKVFNAGNGSLVVTSGIKNLSPWLSLAPSGGTVTTDTLGMVITYTTGSLTGTLRDTIVISANGVSNSPQIVPVEIRILPEPLISYARDTIQGIENVAINPDNATNTGGSADTFYVVGDTLPAGLMLNTANGQIFGTPSKAKTGKAYSIAARNQSGLATAVVSIGVLPAPDTVAPQLSGTLDFTGSAVSDTRINLTWSTPVTQAADAESVLVFMSTSPILVPGGRGKVTGATEIFAFHVPTTGSASKTGLLPNTTYYFGLQVVDTTLGNYSVVALDTVTTAAAGALVNPIGLAGSSFIDSTHVRLKLSGFDGISTIFGYPYAIEIGVWYQAQSYPLTPDKTSTQVFKFGIEALKTKAGAGVTTIDTVVTVPALTSGNFTWYFSGSVYWLMPDSTSPFVSGNGASVYMKDTVPVTNQLIVTGTYYTDFGDSALVVLSNAASVEAKSDTVEVWYGNYATPDFTDRLHVATVPSSTLRSSGGSVSMLLHSTLFKGYEHQMYVAVRQKGANGTYSSNVYGSFAAGYSGLFNHVTLQGNALTATQVSLSWGGLDSVRIVYRENDPVPLNVNLGDVNVSYTVLYPTIAMHDTIISNLNPVTTYCFGLQVYSPQTELWSFVSANATQTLTTKAAGTNDNIPNTLRLSGVQFDEVTHGFIVDWNLNCDGTDFVGKSMSIGISVSPDTSLAQAQATRRVLREDLVPALLQESGIDTINYPLWLTQYDTTYHVSLWLKTTASVWSAPTDSSTDTVHVGPSTWEPVSYFPSLDTVYLFGDRVRMWPPQGFLDIVTDTVRLKNVIPPAGMIVPGVSFAFDNPKQSPSLYIGIRYQPQLLPSGVSQSQVMLYRDSSGVLTVMYGAQRDTVRHFVYALVNYKDLLDTFRVFADTSHPRVVIASDRAKILTGSLAFSDTVTLSDNIRNMKYWIRYGTGGGLMSAGDSMMLDSVLSNVRIQVPGEYVSGANGVRVWVIVSDGVNMDTVRFSHRVQQSSNTLVTQEKEWVPFYANSELANDTCKNLLSSIGGIGALWKYDNRMFRLFCYQGLEWLEYSDDASSAEVFRLRPGRLFWLKTRTQASVNFGTSLTMPLDSVVVIRLPKKAWTDFVLPFKFDIVWHDILDSTNASGMTHADTLLVFHWTLNEEAKMYKADPVYVKWVQALELWDADTVLLSDVSTHVNTYTIYNPTDDTINLRVPPLPAVLSSHLAKRAEGLNKETQPEVAGWSVRIASSSNGMPNSDVYCGYGGGAGPQKSSWYPAPPSFTRSGIGVVDHVQNGLYGFCIEYGARKTEGYVYELALYNNDEDGKEISTIFTCTAQGALPSDMGVWIYDPASGSIDEAQSHRVSVAAGARQYRYLVVSKKEDVAGLMNGKVLSLKLALIGIMPNPFKRLLTIRYSIPYTGVGRISIRMFDVSGRLVWETAKDGKKMLPGVHNIVWNGQNMHKQPVSAGVYMVKVGMEDLQKKREVVFNRKITFMP